MWHDIGVVDAEQDAVAQFGTIKARAAGLDRNVAKR
jgi:hypothetical protein